MSNFPTSLDSLTNPTSTDSQSTVSHASQHTNANDAIEALETKVGITNSTDVNSLDYKVTQLNKYTTKGDIVTYTGSATTRLPVGTDGYMLVADSTQSSGLKYITPSSGGTVTTLSVTSANGFTGTVANPTSTPAITLTTSITGILKGNGTAISAATAGTDYALPTSVTLPGMVIEYAGSSAPTGWLLCDGSAISRTTYADLFTVISTTYGVGDGSTTFNLPDGRGKVSVQKNTGTFSSLGGTGGAETHTLSESEMPAHSHGVLNYSGGGANSGSIKLDTGVQITGTYTTQSSNGYNIIESKGSSVAHNNLQPYIVFNRIIKT